MNTSLNRTHDASRKSWVSSANDGITDFPVQNLPLGLYRLGADSALHPGVAIGDQILQLTQTLKYELLNPDAAQAVRLMMTGSLNELMAADPKLTQALRHAVFDLLVSETASKDLTNQCLIAHADVQMSMPANIGDFSDFSVSRHHNTTLGQVAKRENALHPNFNHLPIAYHGRSSSIVVSGVDCRRPYGQRGLRTDSAPTYGPSARLDYEMELGLLIGQPSVLGDPVTLGAAEDHLFGFCMLNDWSARDIQSWEITPLGPFQAKSFMTTISPWVITVEALAPYRVATVPWPESIPPLIDYFVNPKVASMGAFDVTVRAAIQTPKMRAASIPAKTISTGRLADHPWNVFQLITHQTHNGCNLRAGDLIGTGTISGPGPGEQGCLQEISRGGTNSFDLPGGETRTYLEDGDEVSFTATCTRPGFVKIGFGECKGVVLPAHDKN